MEGSSHSCPSRVASLPSTSTSSAPCLYGEPIRFSSSLAVFPISRLHSPCPPFCLSGSAPASQRESLPDHRRALRKLRQRELLGQDFRTFDRHLSRDRDRKSVV